MALRSTLRRTRRGLTLIEAALVLAITALVLGGFAQLLSESGENVRARASADRLREVAKASELYVNAYSRQIRDQAEAQGGRVVIPITGTGTVGVLQSVQTAGYLSTIYQDRNTFNQTHQLIVRTRDDPIDPSRPKRLEAMVTSVPASAAVTARIPDRILGKVAQLVGSKGGFYPAAAISPTSPSVILGVGGGWRASPADWNIGSPGTVQALLNTSDTSVLSDFLNRNNIGVDEANTMRTGVIFNQTDRTNDIESTNPELKLGPNVRVPGYVAAGPCTEGQVGGNLVACNDVIGNRLVDRTNQAMVVDPGARSIMNTASMNRLDVQDLKPRYLDITNTILCTTIPGDRFETTGSGATLTPATPDPLTGSPGCGPGTTQVQMRDLLPRYVAKDGFVASQGASEVEVPTECLPNAAGTGVGKPRIFLTPLQDSYKVDTNTFIKAQQTLDRYLYWRDGTTTQAVVDGNCTAGNCTFDKNGFLAPGDIQTAPAVTAINTAPFQFYRQYTASSPYLNGLGKWVWNVNLSGTANADGVPWSALAMTYCFW